MKFFLFVLIAVFVASSTGFTYVVFYLPAKIDGQTVISNLIYFFVSGFISLASFTSLMLYSAGLIRERRLRPVEYLNGPKQIFRKSLRRGFLVSFAVFVYLGFRLIGIANPINVILLVLVAALTEVYFSSR